MIDRLEWQIMKCFKLEEKIGELEDLLKQSQDEARDYREVLETFGGSDGYEKVNIILAKHTKTEKER